jgi:hypothetical protein
MSAALGLSVALALLVGLFAFKGRRTFHEMLFPGLYRSVGFPEDRFPAADAHAFRERVARGYGRMRDTSVVICGITRNDAETLPLTIRRIERMAACFRDHHVVVFENGSTDRTPALLGEWAGWNPNVTVLSEPRRGVPGFPSDRFERLALCRNRYVDWMNAAADAGSQGYVVVVDFDLRGGWSLDGIASTFAEDDWDAVGSNSLGYHNLRRTYYDTAALRPRTVLQESWWHRLVGEAWQLRRGTPMIPVESAFGGLGVYRREVFRSRRYSGRLDGAPACEHLSLNADGRLRAFLNPSQITVVGTQEHRAAREQWPVWRRDLHLLLRNW